MGIAVSIAIFNIVIMLSGFLIPMAVPVIILLAVRRVLRGRSAVTSTTATTPASSRRRWLSLGLIPLAGVSLFTGLMVASVGGALYPPLTRIAAPLACDGEFSIETYTYSYKPGQRGSGYQTICVDRATGERKDVSLPTFLWNSAIFAGVAFVPLLLLAWLLVGKLRHASGSLKPPSLGNARTAIFKQFLDNLPRTGPTTSDDRSVEERLRELRHLRDKELIDANDYETRKAEILAQL